MAFTQTPVEVATRISQLTRDEVPRPELQPGESAEVRFPLRARDMSVWNATTHAWQLVHGSFGVAVGLSSRDAAALRGAAGFEPMARARARDKKRVRGGARAARGVCSVISYPINCRS